MTLCLFMLFSRLSFLCPGGHDLRAHLEDVVQRAWTTIINDYKLAYIACTLPINCKDIKIIWITQNIDQVEIYA